MAAIRELLLKAKARLKAADVENPSLDSELLLASVLGIDRTSLLANLNQEVSLPDQEKFLGLVERRSRHEPIAYILGYKEFYGRLFCVSRSVLIPRPETEMLVDLAKKLATKGAVVADVGTGSGAIAISIAIERPDVKVVATDISHDALDVARRNVQKHGVQDRVFLLQGNLLDPVHEMVDMVVANLPYIPESEADSLQPDVILWEPRTALFGGEDGLEYIRELLGQLPKHCSYGAYCLLEVDPRLVDKLKHEIKLRFPDASIVVLQDLAGLPRVVSISNFTSS
ncbi:modification methylase, HemK family [Thermobaculum terrenum ATCC BAA-798]|uniref:Release factor glutamine methyltransferase n=1 Tax=Thermobaculum terrenum (strain ATCC BAA-798 / CCMEE 7001 / YNP1) TaxID=525904 RepID=D1CC23_THET1|nr:peptide chain release factor N(5)-glutamine methyltransferase [Thermobaculum terrenum]ACZ42338.1 modification methylase, HemK family [Thermobaculum terrenum ATCC BAA-798]